MRKTKLRRFEDRLKEDLRDPEFSRAFDREKRALRIAMQMADIRRRRRLSQKDLARKMRTSQQTISRLESGDYDGFSLRTLEKFTRATGSRLIVELRP